MKQLDYKYVSDLLQDKINHYNSKAASAIGVNAEFFALCAANLTKALGDLNDAVYFNRQIVDPSYQDNPDAPLDNPDQYITSDDLDQAMQVVKEIKEMEYNRVASDHGLYFLGGTLIFGIVIGFLLGSNNKRKKDGSSTE